jgi:hypothetical protein
MMTTSSNEDFVLIEKEDHGDNPRASSGGTVEDMKHKC